MDLVRRIRHLGRNSEKNQETNLQQSSQLPLSLGQLPGTLYLKLRNNLEMLTNVYDTGGICLFEALE